MAADSKYTRFRSYMLEDKGGSYSYFDGNFFTLIEARLNNANRENLNDEMALCGVSKIHCLHITSWDSDHCKYSELEEILGSFKPRKIEYPGYEPHTDNGEKCLEAIFKYQNETLRQRNKKITAISITPSYIKSLDKARALKYSDVVYNPLEIDTKNANNRSTVKIFRTGSFNVLSLGDVESENIASYLRELSTIKNEVDVMIMAHHGADNGFTTSAFLKKVKPLVAVVGSNFANQYDHPKQEIRDILYQEGIKLCTTKTGDVVIYSIKTNTGEFRVDNYIAKGQVINSTKDFIAKKRELLKHSPDTLTAKLKYSKRIY